MRGVVHRRARARHDLVAIYRHYVLEVGVGTADRLLAAAEVAFRRIASMPGSGARYPVENQAFGELRHRRHPGRGIRRRR